jgi:hypothetical protein
MIEQALDTHTQTAIHDYISLWLDNKEYPFNEKDIISADEWRQLRMIHQFLAPFEGAINFMQGDRPTLDRAYESLNILQAHCERFLVCCIIVYCFSTNSDRALLLQNLVICPFTFK